MKKLLFIAAIIITASCSSDDGDDCQTKKNAITKDFATQIQYVKDHPGPNGIEYNKITLLEQERDNKLAKACN